MSELAGVVVHWRDEEALGELIDAWPEDPRFELVVIDNGRTLQDRTLTDRGLESSPGKVRIVDPGRNLGFAGGVNRGVAETSAPWILVLNPDAAPEPGAVEALLTAAERFVARWPETAGVAPHLFEPDGSSQHRWQLQPLPTAWTLLAQCFFLAGERGPVEPPEEGATIGQPAAAVLALRREALETVGGLDEGFFPAWFEDVDLARRLADAGRNLRFAPTSRFRHARGGSVSSLGYGRFLWLYYRHLSRYLQKHHGEAWTLVARLALVVTLCLRVALLPLRRPRRATSRLDAARGLFATALGAASGWRLPSAWTRRFDGERRHLHEIGS